MAPLVFDAPRDVTRHRFTSFFARVPRNPPPTLTLPGPLPQPLLHPLATKKRMKKKKKQK